MAENLTLSRPGAQNLGSDPAKMFRDVFTGEVLTAFDEHNIMKDWHKMRTITHGKSASFAVMGRANARYHTAGEAILGSNKIAANERTINVDNLLIADVAIYDLEDAMNHYDVRREYSKQLGVALAKRFDETTMRVAVLAARSSGIIDDEPGGSVIKGGATLATDGELLAEAVFSCSQTFDEKDVPEQERCLNPVFRDFVTDQNGKIFALPISVSGAYAFTINPTVFGEMGLTMDDIPTNFIDLCAFVTRWNDEFVEDYPNFAPLDSTEKYKDRMFRLALREWKGYCQATNQDLHFDDPIFREMVAAIDAMRCDRIEESNKKTSDEESDYKQPLIFTGTWMLNSYYDGDVTFGKDKTPKLIQMTLTKDTAFYLGQGVELELMFVNPRTTDSDEIGTLLEYVIKNIRDEQKVELVAGCTTPIENPWYEEQRKQNEADLVMYQKAYDEASAEEKNAYKEQLDEFKLYMEQSAESDRYTVSPAYIQRYQEVILPALYIGKPTVLDSTDNTSGLKTLVQRYIDGQITLDQFIREADGKLRMIQLENQ